MLDVSEKLIAGFWQFPVTVRIWNNAVKVAEARKRRILRYDIDWCDFYFWFAGMMHPPPDINKH